MDKKDKKDAKDAKPQQQKPAKEEKKEETAEERRQKEEREELKYQHEAFSVEMYNARISIGNTLALMALTAKSVFQLVPSV